MSWLHKHIIEFVVPGIKALVDAPGNATSTYDDHYLEEVLNKDDSSSGLVSSVTLADVQRLPKYNLRPASVCKHPEAGLVYTALRSFNAQRKMQPDAYQAALKALETCSPDVVFKGKVTRYSTLSSNKHPQHDVVHNIVKKSWRALRRISLQTGGMIVLPGRDVWLWEVMSRKHNVPSVFDPRVSRILSRSPDALRAVMASWNIKLEPNTIIFDTGFAGTIYRAMCEASGVKMVNLMLSTSLKEPNKMGRHISCQVFPNHAKARAKALAIEYLPKYFKTGTIRDDVPVQYLSPLEDFIDAALLTIWFWHHRSPRWIDQSKSKEETPKLKKFSFMSCGFSL